MDGSEGPKGPNLADPGGLGGAKNVRKAGQIEVGRSMKAGREGQKGRKRAGRGWRAAGLGVPRKKQIDARLDPNFGTTQGFGKGRFERIRFLKNVRVGSKLFPDARFWGSFLGSFFEGPQNRLGQMHYLPTTFPKIGLAYG